MKRILVKNKGVTLGYVSYHNKPILKKDMHLYEWGKSITYRELEDYYDDVWYTPYPNETLEGIVMSYEQDAERLKKDIKKIKRKNHIEKLTPFTSIRLYGVPSKHLCHFGYTADLKETKSITFIEDIHEFINKNRHYIVRNNHNGFDVDLINDEINDLNKIYYNYIGAQDDDIREYLYPHLRDGYLEILDRFKELTGKDFKAKKRFYPLT